jgi:hypothetical protein
MSVYGDGSCTQFWLTDENLWKETGFVWKSFITIKSLGGLFKR